ncbi:C40 family peptidase [Marinigracilibium pacificum]|uniref:C40 family peptidase n=1 Tax=Marinigracilibium pacificum TaxID=2729599 RepID=A0A848J5L3_9BACT|nr:C40 family peptidase [Marinigracilibium pacificum]NMM50538.1 C40 family peptidase [Marinigracilibium pacificum]
MENNEKGICRLSIIPVRSEPRHASEMVTQLLFGDHYEVIKEEKGWKKIKIAFDDYEGWIDGNQFHGISNEYYDQIAFSDFKVSTEKVSTILFNKHSLDIVMGSVLPLSTNELFKMEEQIAFNGESKSMATKGTAEDIKNTALKLNNSPYLWGGKSPFGYDCSGFVQIVYKINGYFLPRDASQQVNSGVGVKDHNEAELGDLAFFVNDKGKVDHVGIILDGNTIIHASGRVRVDELNENGIFNKEKNIYTHKKLHAIRHVLRKRKE